jgi:hypothetical protein
MKPSKDSFSIDLVLRHSLHSPESIAAALSLKPKASWPVGEDLGRVRAKWSFFYARLLEGVGCSGHERALKNISRFLRKNAPLWADFANGNGEVELILNHTVSPQKKEGDECFELRLTPTFLRDLSACGIGLIVQGWQGSVGKDSPNSAAFVRKRYRH